MPRIWISSQWKINIAGAGITRRAMPALVSGVALMAGALASSGAQAQCTDPGAASFPFGNGSGINALTSVVSEVNTAFLINGSPFVSVAAADRPAEGRRMDKSDRRNARYTGQQHLHWERREVYFTTRLEPMAPATRRCPRIRRISAGHDMADIGLRRGSDIDLHVGVLVGYIGTNFHDATPGSTLTGTFEVPFAGVYGTLSKGNFFADAQARFDYYQGQLNDPGNGISGERFDARGFSVTGNMGYRVDLGNKWTLEPSLGAIYSTTASDAFSVAGTAMPPVFGP